MTAAGAARYDATPMRNHHPARHYSRPKGLRSLMSAVQGAKTSPFRVGIQRPSLFTFTGRRGYTLVAHPLPHVDTDSHRVRSSTVRKLAVDSVFATASSRNQTSKPADNRPTQNTQVTPSRRGRSWPPDRSTGGVALPPVRRTGNVSSQPSACRAGVGSPAVNGGEDVTICAFEDIAKVDCEGLSYTLSTSIANATKTTTPKRTELDIRSFSSGVVKCFPCGAVRPSFARFDTERRSRDAGDPRPHTMNNERMPLTTDRDGDPPSNQLDDSRDQDDRDDHPNHAGDAPLSKLREIFFIFFSELRSCTRKAGSESKTGGRSHERSEWLHPLRQQWGEGVQTPSPPSPLLVERVEEVSLHLSTVSGEEVPGGGRNE